VWDEVVAGTVADPRSSELGSRVVVTRDAAAKFGDDVSAYEARRIQNGIPKGGVDFTYGDAFPHDVNMDLINGVDFRKGCYVGQEVVSRVQHRSTARRRILKLAFDGAAPAAGELEIGVVGSSFGNVALVSVRTDKLEDARAAGVAVSAGGVGLLP
jgi:folate-binding protein YgfZ